MIADRRNGGLFLLMLLAILACYNPVFLTRYGFSDDWVWLFSSAHDPAELLQWDILTGRPSYGLLRWLGSFAIGSVNAFSLVRLFSVATIFLLCLFIYRFISDRAIFSGSLQRAVFALLICALPSFQVYAAWTICFPFTASVLLSGWSYKLLAEGDTLKRAFLSFLLLTLAFSIYQPAAMCFVFFAFLDLVIAPAKIRPARFFKPAVVLFAGMVIALFLAKALPLILFGEVTSRTTLSFALFTKLKWFISEPLVNAICNFDLGKKAVYLTLAILVTLFGIYTLTAAEKKKHLLFYVALFALAASAPGLLVKESWAAYRTIPAISMIITTLFLTGVFAIFEKYNLGEKSYLSLAVVVLMMANNNMQSGFSTPQQIEYQILKKEIVDTVPGNYTGTLYYSKPTDRIRSYAGSQKYDEFGAFSLGMDWSFKGMAQMIKQQENMRYDIAVDPVVTEHNRCVEHCKVITITKSQ